MTPRLTMIAEITAVLDSHEADLAREKSAALAEINRTTAEVARLAGLRTSAENAVKDAEVRAADAVASAGVDPADEAEVMSAVGAARARHDSIVTAHRRAKDAETQAQAALKPLGYREEKLKSNRHFANVIELARRIDDGLRIFSEVIPQLNAEYSAGVKAVWGTRAEWPNGSGPRLPSDLHLAGRMNSILFKSLRVHFFGQAVGSDLSMCRESTLAEHLEELLPMFAMSVAEVTEVVSRGETHSFARPK